MRDNFKLLPRTRALLRKNISIIPVILVNILITVNFIVSSKGIPYFPGGINLRPFHPAQSALDLVTSAWSPANLGDPAYPDPSVLFIYLFQLLMYNDSLV